MEQINPGASSNGLSDPSGHSPSYHDVDPALQNHNQAHTPPDDFVPGARHYHSVYSSKRQSGVVTLSPVLTQNHDKLHQLITQQACVPPRPCLHVRGNHKEIRREAKDAKRERVTDFDFKIDLTRGLFPCGNPGDWSELHVVRDRDGQKAFRGSRWPSRGRMETNPKGRVDLGQADQTPIDSTDGLDAGGSGPALMAWCERFCTDPAPVKSFTFTRTLQGFNIHPIRDVLTSGLRASNYAGEVKVSSYLANESITIYSPHWINRLRNNRFAFWACVILQLWIVTWPVIWLLERRYEVVRSAWWSSRNRASSNGERVYLSGRDEAALAEYWTPAVQQGARRRVNKRTVLRDDYAEQLRKRGLQSMEPESMTTEECLDGSDRV